ncbi:hypothetical protein JQ554_09935 [Bradyrhizobium diazoefficiens]|nr:hypothetical protein [Bradyrhizobium diazoefficiens]UCF52176.1 MAG: hypothetical protein JSV48_23315 [Bradyrhizobium sp.]MBR0965116.1 hypothetical protein [Bradyrhizobium diazoefficiens]MBR0977513.1 hypothetical protein [Bradyrhizobium diazoefficiens]MBR1007805.1 hypothetical protein [Bradyrhizobium diazoefficiens]MBR1013578.1 hypothetical protein [Bradyrhizobium diazoefficiens]
MDWKSFIAAIVGSLAWPIVVLSLLFIVRKQLVGLAERLQEFSVGGAKATFEKQLETARKEAARLPPPSESLDEVPDNQRIVPLTEEKKFLRLANEFPEAAIIEVFKDIEALLFRIGDAAGIKRTSADRIMDELFKHNEVDENARDLFVTLRSARNLAAHGSGDRRVSPGEALDYSEHSKRLMVALSFVLGKVQAEASLKERLLG